MRRIKSMQFTNVCSRLRAAGQLIEFRQAENDPLRTFEIRRLSLSLNLPQCFRCSYVTGTMGQFRTVDPSAPLLVYYVLTLEQLPIASNDTPAGRAQNRRVEMAIGGL